MRWFRFHIERWRSGTVGLTPNEIVVYLTLICELYDNGGFLVMTNHVEKRLCGLAGNMRPTSFRKAFHRLIEVGKIDMNRGQVRARSVEAEIKSRQLKARQPKLRVVK